MSTLKVNEVRHLSNSGTANIVLESNATTNLQATSTLGLTVTGTLTTSGVATFNGNVQIGNATTDTLTLTSKVSGNNNYSGFTGEIRMYAGNAAGDDPPDGWLYCNGDTIGQTSGDHTGSDLQNLFNLLSDSALWGNGGSESWANATVKLPDFRSRSPVGVHTGAENSITAGLTARALSDTAGTETHTLTTAELASHSHASTIVASTTGQTASHNITANQSSHTHTGTTNSTTPGATGSTTPGAGGSTTPGAGGSTTPNNTGSTTPSNTGSANPTINSSDPGDTNSSGNHRHNSATHLYGRTGASHGYPAVGGDANNYGWFYTAYDGTHTHTMPSHSHTQASHSHSSAAHTHSSAAHTHTGAAHTHTGAAHTHTSAAHTHAFTTGATDPAITISGSVSLSGTTHTHTLTADSTGSGTAHTNLSPIIAVNYIIKI